VLQYGVTPDIVEREIRKRQVVCVPDDVDSVRLDNVKGDRVRTDPPPRAEI
jgi:hypothetical protein